MSIIKQIHYSTLNTGGTPPLLYNGGEVKDIITGLFYRGSCLCFHILLLAEDGKTTFFQEYTDYTLYKTALSKLQTAIRSNAQITLPEKNTNELLQPAKVA